MSNDCNARLEAYIRIKATPRKLAMDPDLNNPIYFDLPFSDEHIKWAEDAGLKVFPESINQEGRCAPPLATDSNHTAWIALEELSNKN